MKMIVVQNPMGFDIPAGGIVLWYGDSTNLPAGWSIYATAQGQFIMGAYSGAKNLTSSGALTHTHGTPDTGAVAGHTHSVNTSSGNGGGDQFYPGVGNYDAAGGSHSHSTSGGTTSSGGHSHTVSTTNTASNLSTYYRLYWIQKQ